MFLERSDPDTKNERAVPGRPAPRSRPTASRTGHEPHATNSDLERAATNKAAAQVSRHTSRVSGARRPRVAGGYCTGRHRERTYHDHRAVLDTPREPGDPRPPPGLARAPAIGSGCPHVATVSAPRPGGRRAEPGLLPYSPLCTPVSAQRQTRPSATARPPHQEPVCTMRGHRGQVTSAQHSRYTCPPKGTSGAPNPNRL